MVELLHVLQRLEQRRDVAGPVVAQHLAGHELGARRHPGDRGPARPAGPLLAGRPGTRSRRTTGGVAGAATCSPARMPATWVPCPAPSSQRVGVLAGHERLVRHAGTRGSRAWRSARATASMPESSTAQTMPVPVARRTPGAQPGTSCTIDAVDQGADLEVRPDAVDRPRGAGRAAADCWPPVLRLAAGHAGQCVGLDQAADLLGGQPGAEVGPGRPHRSVRGDLGDHRGDRCQRAGQPARVRRAQLDHDVDGLVHAGLRHPLGQRPGHHPVRDQRRRRRLVPSRRARAVPAVHTGQEPAPRAADTPCSRS